MFGFHRNDHSPCIFFHTEMQIQLEQHGDDFLGLGNRGYIFAFVAMMKEHFAVKESTMVSRHPEDSNEGFFLKRRISVDDMG